MAGSSFSRRSRRRVVALGSAILISAVCLAGPIGSAGAADSDIKATAPDATHPIITVIVTRHGVRSISNIAANYWNTPENYKWAPWEPVEELFLTEHGYQLMTLMGRFYVLDAGIKVDCDHQGVFVYADKVQRTLLTAQALVKGLWCKRFEVEPLSGNRP